jgi:hypothetical protein
MPIGRPKKHRDPYDGYEALDVNDDIAAVIRRNPKWAKESVVRNNPLWEATNMKRYIIDTIPPRRGRPPKLESLSIRELSEMEARVKRAKIIKRNEEMDRIKAHVAKLAKAHGFKDVKDILR